MHILRVQFTNAMSHPVAIDAIVIVSMCTPLLFDRDPRWNPIVAMILHPCLRMVLLADVGEGCLAALTASCVFA